MQLSVLVRNRVFDEDEDLWGFVAEPVVGPVEGERGEVGKQEGEEEEEGGKEEGKEESKEEGKEKSKEEGEEEGEEESKEEGEEGEEGKDQAQKNGPTDEAQWEIYLVFPDEAGDLKGEVRDTVCARFVPPGSVRAQVDSLQRMLRGELDAMGFAITGEQMPEAQLRPAEAESLRGRVQILEGQLERSLAESLRCSAPIWVSAYAVEDTISAAEIRTQGRYEITNLPAGIYGLKAFRDLNGNGVEEETEPRGAFPQPIELLPGRTVEDIEIDLCEPRAMEGGQPGGRGPGATGSEQEAPE